MEAEDEPIIKELQLLQQKSEESYEKSITIIASGTLILSLTFIEKIVKIDQSTSLWILVLSWAFMALTLLANLVSHQVSSHFHGKTVEDFRTSNPQTMKNVENRNSIIVWINWGTTFALITGITLLIIFCSLNAYKMSKKLDPIRPQVIETDRQKGRTIQVPRGPMSPNPTSPSPAPVPPQPSGPSK